MLTYEQPAAHFGSITTASSLPSSAMTTLSTTNGAVHSNLVSNGTSGEERHLWIVGGPAGTGKTTVAKHLATTQSMPYIEGDEFHPQANIEKMAAGIPLTDADRWDWLILLRKAAMAALEGGATGVVVTCSSLKEKYRDELRMAQLKIKNVSVHFILLSATEEVLLSRVGLRKNHYMKANMVQSQLNSFELPVPSETDVSVIDVNRSMAEVENLALRVVEEVMGSEAHP